MSSWIVVLVLGIALDIALVVVVLRGVKDMEDEDDEQR